MTWTARVIWCSLFSLAPMVNAETKLDLNDVSWLWPAPVTEDDLTFVIPVDELHSSDGAPVWPDEHFNDLLAAIDRGLTEVEVSRCAGTFR